MSEWIVSLLLLAGSIFLFIAGIALLRLPDVYMRTSATTKAVTFGMGCLLLAMVVHFKDMETTAVAALVMLFFCLTSPVAGHVVARAAYLAGEPLWMGTIADELAGHYDARIYRMGRAHPGATQTDKEGEA